MSPRVEEVQEKLSSTTIVKLGNPSTNEWIADIGATYHMSPDWSLFSSYSFAKVTHRVQTARGGTLLVKGVGTLPVNPRGVLEDV